MSENNIHTDNIGNFTITRHAQERYAERILNKRDKVEVNRYVTLNTSKINIDINKMITYGECVYTGKNPRKDKFGGTTQLSIYKTGAWVVLVNPDNLSVITLFKIDLGLDDEINTLYVDKLMNKFLATQKELEDTRVEVLTENDRLRNEIEDINTRIALYRSYIKKYEDAVAGYKAIMDANLIKVSEAEEKVNVVLEKLVSPK